MIFGPFHLCQCGACLPAVPLRRQGAQLNNDRLLSSPLGFQPKNRGPIMLLLLFSLVANTWKNANNRAPRPAAVAGWF